MSSQETKLRRYRKTPKITLIIKELKTRLPHQKAINEFEPLSHLTSKPACSDSGEIDAAFEAYWSSMYLPAHPESTIPVIRPLHLRQFIWTAQFETTPAIVQSFSHIDQIGRFVLCLESKHP